MTWIILESLVALGLALFIVWWTMRGPRRRSAHPPPHPPTESAGDRAAETPRQRDPEPPKERNTEPPAASG